jgi:hypothetical protein
MNVMIPETSIRLFGGSRARLLICQGTGFASADLLPARS